MQELFFGWVGWDGTVGLLSIFIFVTKRSITFKNKSIPETQEKNLIYLNSHRDYVICFYCYSKLNWNALVPHLLLSPLQLLVGLVTQRPLFPVWERVHIAWQDQITMAKKTMQQYFKEGS